MSDFPFQGKKILDVTCGSRSIWFDKHHPATVYCDIREEDHTQITERGDRRTERHINVNKRKSGYYMQFYGSSIPKRHVLACGFRPAAYSKTQRKVVARENVR